MAFGSGSLLGGGSKSVFGGGGGSGGSSDEPGSISLNMTALMDILSNLLFFLLASYAASDIEIKGAEDMQLPTSSSEQEATMSILVRITLEVVEVEGKPVVKVVNGEVPGTADQDRIEPIYKELVRIGELGKKGVQMTEENTVLLVLADKRADYALVSKVLKSAGYAGYPNFRFAVMQR